jgi:thiamine pyrophosphate-dependent acetolactate synthase large subunit-like protein
MTRPALDRRTLVSSVLARREDALVVAGLGSSCWDVAAAGDQPLDFYLWGAMGSAAMTGLGLALAQPRRRTLVITGDGEMLMGLGSLATIAVAAPGNLALLVLDNESYTETGNQPTHTASGVDLAAMALGAGFRQVLTVTEAGQAEGLGDFLHQAEGPVLAVAKISAAAAPLVLPPRDGAYLVRRFRDALPVS